MIVTSSSKTRRHKGLIRLHLPDLMQIPKNELSGFKLLTWICREKMAPLEGAGDSWTPLSEWAEWLYKVPFCPWSVGRTCSAGLGGDPHTCRDAVLCPEQELAQQEDSWFMVHPIGSVFGFWAPSRCMGASFEMFVMEQSVQGGHSWLKATCMVNCLILSLCLTIVTRLTLRMDEN